MIEFITPQIGQKEEYDRLRSRFGGRGCEYNFSNLFLWGRQRMAFLGENVVFFSQFDRKSVYPFPLGQDLKAGVDAVIHDARARDIPCRLTGLSLGDCERLESLYPGRFRFHCDRDGFDYVYAIEDLAQLKGRKYQRKRNHINRFRQLFPDYTLEPITQDNIRQVEQLVQQWYEQREQADPMADFHMEKAAVFKALRYGPQLQMEGLLLKDGDRPLAMTMGSRLEENTFDIHFEKALEDADGAYPTINWEFARYLQQKYPQLRYLNREDDMGIAGLRKAKLSYYPHHMVEKHWACLLEDGYDY